MMRLTRPTAALLLTSIAGAALVTAQQQPIVIRTEVISVPVTVFDNKGRFVAGLKQTDFEVLEDRVAQAVTSFDVTESGVASELLLDVSGSMGAKLDEVKRAATQFVRQMGPRDVARIVEFDERVTPLTEFSGDKAALESAVNKARIGGATALYNAINHALADFVTRRAIDESEKRHRAVVVLTDGDDTASAERPDDVLTKARGLDAMVYSLSLDRANGRPVTDSTSAIFLRELAETTGGQLWFPEVNDLQKVYRQLADELRQQYVIGFVSSNTSSQARWRNISVRVINRNNLRLRHRMSYMPGRQVRDTQ
jgi:Ca-activated chloride channel family protein